MGLTQETFSTITNRNSCYIVTGLNSYLQVRRSWKYQLSWYMNWYVANEVVLIGTFARPEFDEKGIEAVATLFPSRQVIGINVRRLWRRGGGIHCVTQQQPSLVSTIPKK